MPTATIDDAHTNLQAAGWSVGDIHTLDTQGRRVWHVYVHRGDQQVLVRAPTQTEAWAAAWRQAEVVVDR